MNLPKNWATQIYWKISNMQQSKFLTNKQNLKIFAEISMPFCNLEVKIRIESLAMQNCESWNCQFSGKSRNIQNCFWRPSPQFTSYTWISMTLDILCCRQKFKTCMKQMFSKHFKTFHISHVLKSKKMGFYCSLQFWDGLRRRSKSPGFVFSPSQRGNWIWN